MRPFDAVWGGQVRSARWPCQKSQRCRKAGTCGGRGLNRQWFQRVLSLRARLFSLRSPGTERDGALQSRAGTGSSWKGWAGLGSLCSARGWLSRCRWQPCLPSSSFPASWQPPNKGLRRWLRSSSLSNSSNCPVEEREGGRLLLSAGCPKVKSQLSSLK